MLPENVTPEIQELLAVYAWDRCDPYYLCDHLIRKGKVAEALFVMESKNLSASKLLHYAYYSKNGDALRAFVAKAKLHTATYLRWLKTADTQLANEKLTYHEYLDVVSAFLPYIPVREQNMARIFRLQDRLGWDQIFAKNAAAWTRTFPHWYPHIANDTTYQTVLPYFPTKGKNKALSLAVQQLYADPLHCRFPKGLAFQPGQQLMNPRIQPAILRLTYQEKSLSPRLLQESFLLFCGRSGEKNVAEVLTAAWSNLQSLHQWYEVTAGFRRNYDTDMDRVLALLQLKDRQGTLLAAALTPDQRDPWLKNTYYSSGVSKQIVATLNANPYTPAKLCTT